MCNNIKITNMGKNAKFQYWNNNNNKDTTKKYEKNDKDSSNELNCNFYNDKDL